MKGAARVFLKASIEVTRSGEPVAECVGAEKQHVCISIAFTMCSVLVSLEHCVAVHVVVVVVVVVFVALDF